VHFEVFPDNRQLSSGHVEGRPTSSGRDATSIWHP